MWSKALNVSLGEPHVVGNLKRLTHSGARTGAE